ncbi:peptidylprolyl isomerase [Oceanicola sp. S124]|uniref:peptidylprolyl isomerase n=1 Tax=Oceanicola sp. S124 TaxID=1042378 RepID=UPI0002558DAA|nr:peptidylprolyl isomerase [Oceanicola sp. S124]
MLHRLTLAAALALSVPAHLLAQDAPAEAPAASAEAIAVEGPVTLDTVLARVGETEITMGHVIAAQIEAPEPYNQMPLAQIAAPLLQQLVQQEELRQQFEGEMAKATGLLMDNTERKLIATDAMLQHLNEVISDERIQAEYDAMYPADAEGPTEYNASHILVETEEEAKALIEQLEGGEDFAKLARDKSTGPSGPNGGQLGWFTPDKMVAPFSAALVEMEAGDISAPVQTQFGWHVIKLNETRERKPALEEVREQIVAELQQSESTAYLDELAANSDASMADMGSIDLSQQSVMPLYQELQE